MEELLKPLLRPVRERMRAIATLRALSAVLLCGALAAGFVWWAALRWQQADPRAAMWLFWIVIGGCVVALVLARLRYRNWRSVAGRVEQRFPSLKQRLLTALDQQPDATGLRFNALQQQLHNEVASHARRYRWQDAVSRPKLWFHRIAAALCFAAFALVLLQLRQLPPSGVPFAHAAPGAATSGAVRVEPGNIDLEKGSPLTVVATFAGPTPRNVQLQLESESEMSSREMRRNLDDPAFATMVSSITSDTLYRVTFDGRETQSYRVTVFEYPQLVRSDAELTFPDYSLMPQKRIDDTRRVTAVEGTTLRWLLTLNKPVTVAELVPDEGETLVLEQGPDDPQHYFVDIPLVESQRWKVHLVDEDQRENRNPVELSVKVLPNAPPEIKLVSARDYSVSPLEELPLGATARDDFGLLKMGIAYEIAGQPPREQVLTEAAGRREKGEVNHLLALEQLEAQPDQLLSYYFWAEDVGPDGQLRRTASDMFFAEIRPFEEIYRQGDSPPGGGQQQQGSQAGQQAEELAELQKQIISATWRVIRDAEAGTLDPADPFADAGLLVESQRTALQSLDQLAQQVQAPEAGRTIEEIRAFMQQSLTGLERSFGTDSAAPLSGALAAQQSAYQSLLKLRAREFQVSRAQQSGGSSSGARSARQQQLDQLEIEQDESRYETQQQAQESAEQAQAREDRQILSRLRELARRQEDLNERLKQLQNALEAAEDEEQREQIERQLRRLREQQEELLRDTDELAQRLESDNRESTQQASDQLQETRENVQQAAESLRQQDASGALAAGTRAERSLEQLRDDFRDATSSQFREAMQQMQQQAEQLEEQQDELGRQLTESQQQEEPAGLRRQNQPEELREQLVDQRESLDELLESMEQTVRNAEESEPLLAEQLYEAHRAATGNRVADRLDQTREALRRGMMPEAQQLEQSAREGIRSLRQQIDNAAESVLGNRAEALRRAEQELERLSRELNREIEANNPQDPTADEPQERGAPASRASEGDRQPAGQGSEPQDPQSQQSQQGQQSRSSSQESPDPQNPQGSGQPSQQDGQPQDGQPQSARQEQQSSQSGGSESPGQSPSESQSESQSQQQSGGESQATGGNSANREGARRGERSAGLRDQAGPLTRGQTGGETREQRGGGFEELDFGEVPLQPLTGDDYRDWSDRLRDVEEMVEDPELRNRAAAIRDRAREFRAEVTRHSRQPQWSLVREMIAIPLEELRRDVAIELRRESAERNAVVPIDRDPVPARYSDAVRRYYERLGSGQ